LVIYAKSRGTRLDNEEVGVLPFVVKVPALVLIKGGLNILFLTVSDLDDLNSSDLRGVRDSRGPGFLGCLDVDNKFVNVFRREVDFGDKNEGLVRGDSKLHSLEAVAADIRKGSFGGGVEHLVPEEELNIDRTLQVGLERNRYLHVLSWR
jgi:hypothetical protein